MDQSLLDRPLDGQPTAGDLVANRERREPAADVDMKWLDQVVKQRTDRAPASA